MKRFCKLMSIAIQSRMYYRSGFLFVLFTPLILLIGQIMLWNSLYKMRDFESIGNFEKADMFTYMLISFSINNLLTWNSENALSREIRSGAVIARRIRPVSFLVQALADMCGNMVLQAVVNFTLVGLVIILFAHYLTLPNIIIMPVFFISLVMGILLRMMFINLFSLLCFFTTGHLGITWTRIALTDFFSGALIPISLFPDWLQNFSYALPFPLMLQIPASIFLGKPLPIPLYSTIALQAFWIIIFLSLYSMLYGHIRKNMTLAGG